MAVHHLDVGWRPSDMTQRNGRIIIRQGNMNKEVKVFNYVTEGTFDSYLFQTLENKQRFISQIMTSKSPVRSCDDVDEQALSYWAIQRVARRIVRIAMDKEKVGVCYDKHSDTIFPELLSDDAHYSQLVKKKIAAEDALRTSVSTEVWNQYLDLDCICNELESVRYKAMYLVGAADYEEISKQS